MIWSYLYSHIRVSCYAMGQEARPLLHVGPLRGSSVLCSWRQSGWFQEYLSAKSTVSALMRNIDYNFQSNRSWQIIGQWRDRGRRARMHNAAAGNIESRHHWQLLNYILPVFTINLSLLSFQMIVKGLRGLKVFLWRIEKEGEKWRGVKAAHRKLLTVACANAVPRAARAVAGLVNNGAQAGSVGTHRQWRWNMWQALRPGWFSE